MKPFNKKLELLLYKLLNDVLFLWVLIFSGFLLAEGAVPGFFSARFSFTKIIWIFLIIFLSIIWLGKRNEITFETGSEKNIFKNKTILFFFFVSFLLILNSLRNLGLVKAIISSLASFCVLLLLFKSFFFPDKN